MCLAGAVVASWFVTQEVIGSNTAFLQKYYSNSTYSVDSIISLRKISSDISDKCQQNWFWNMSVHLTDTILKDKSQSWKCAYFGAMQQRKYTLYVSIRGFLQLAFSCQILPNHGRILRKKIRQKVGVEPLTLGTIILAPALYTGQPDAYPTVLDHHCL